MKDKTSILIVLFVLLNVPIAFAQQNPLSPLTAKYSKPIGDENQGLAVLIKKDSQIHTVSIGDHNLSADNVFNIGSATKTFTAILLLQEVEKRNLKLTDTIGKYLDPIKNVDSALTIEQLLTHESGLDEVIGKNLQDIFYAKNDSVYGINLLHQIEKNTPEVVGTYSYCNTNYLLLGKIIEKITDKHYFDVLRERIIEPLHMKNTYAYLHKKLPNLATPIHDDKDVSEFLDHRYFSNIANAAGSIASTLKDMENFYTALFETEKLLKKGSLDLMLKSGNSTYGLGIFKPLNAEDNYYSHGGNNIGYSFRNGYDPKTKNLFLVFSNSRIMPQSEALRTDLKLILDGKQVVQLKAINLDTFKKYTGKYLLKEANLELEIVMENNKMYLVSAAQGVKSQLTQTNETTLTDSVVGASLHIIEGSDDSLTFEQNGFITTIKKTTP